MSAVRNTLRKEKISQDMDMPASDAALREYCDRNYHQLLPIIAEKVHREKVQQEKLKAVKARLNFEEVSQHFELGTPSKMRDLRKRLGPRRIRSVSGCPEPRRGRPESPRKRDPERKRCSKGWKRVYSTGLETGGRVCSRTRMTQGVCRTIAVVEILRAITRAPAQEEQSMPLRNIITKEHPHTRRKLCQNAKVKSRDVKGAPKIMRISGFMHGITNPELIKRLLDKILKSVDEMMRITTSFLRGEVAVGNQERKKSLPPFKQQEARHKQNFKKGGYKNQQRSERRQDRFTLLSKSPKEILALEKGKFKAPPLMTTPVRKRNSNKFCEFHEEVGHNTDECMHLKRKIEELLNNRKRSHVIKELKQNSRKDQPKANKKGETSSKDKALAILWYSRGRRLRSKIKTDGFGHYSLIGFSGEITWPLGQLSLLVKIRDGDISTSAWMNFVVVRSSSPYNGIIERPGVRKIQAVLSTAHRMLKFHVAGGVLTLRRSKIIPIEYVTVSGPYGQPSATYQAIEERIKKPADMIGVLRHIAKHRLNIREGCPPVRQKRRSQAANRNQAIQEEDEKLVDAGIMKDVHYHSWLSKSVMVKKHDDNWRMCVDFKDLNKACPKDGYSLPKIDWKVESLCRFPFKCFLDAYKGYYQIKMVDKAFHKQIDRNLEVYVVDLVIKSHTEDKITRDIEETFKTLRQVNMKLNLKKCPFGVEEGMFLGYKVNTKGTKVCPDKVDAVLSLPSLKCLKDVQKLNRKLASLNKFLTKSAEKSLPFFKTLKKCTKKSDFHWTEEAEAAFKQMKQLIAELSTLIAPEEKEKLIVYLAATNEAVSAVLMTEREAKKMPNYFVLPRLKRSGSELNINEKIGFSAGTRQQASEKILPSTPNYSGHRSAHKAKDDPDTAREDKEELPEPWILFTDGSSSEEMGIKNLQANVDSRLVANQVNGTYIAKEADMIRYLEKVRTLTNGFRMFSIKQVPISENKKADALSKIASTSFTHLSKQVLVKELKEKSINELEVLAVVEEEGNTWMTPIYEYLTEETLPAKANKERAMRRKPQRVALINGVLYKKSILRPWLRCVGPLQENYVLKEIHKGSCSMHAGTRSVMAKALRTEYYAHYAQGCKGTDKGMPRLSDSHTNGDTPFSLTYHTESDIPAEIGMPTLRIAKIDMVKNNEALGINLDLLEERREQTTICEAKSKAKMEKYYNSKVRSTSFKPGDLVYRSNNASHAKEVGKLGLK
uniref:Reverse transcriptase/retrotransposon-derived protein RNase H-like domain-containing protein n=1 Tax=Tanacetum cinerariifolium TaxID=118510 RepID=A0A6L2JMU9_TANCI|nr:hypothetical protein [Tanacetum cinerariifolium]